MKVENGKIILSDFGLFSSPTKYEKGQVYDESNDHYYEKANLEEEYELTQSKKEFVIDSWRATLYFLYSKGYNLTKNGEIINLSFIENEFIR
ncbi:MAG: hypothetical protein H6632_00010 [Anaerolineales bacterium]|nr:hypothetical protein [Anaerolineales bacterium]